MRLGAVSSIPFGAQLRIEPALDFRNPATNLPDALTPRMAQAVSKAFSDPMSRFVLNNTHDEIVITAKRVYLPKMVEPHGVEFTVAMESVRGHDAAANTGTYGTYTCNPFASAEPPAPNTLPSLLMVREQVWDRIVTLDETAKRLLSGQG